jgi:hypothetical protein
MSVDIWYTNKKTGRPQASLPGQRFSSIEEAVAEINRYNADSLLKKTHRMHVMPGHEYSNEVLRPLFDCGLVSSAEFLPRIHDGGHSRALES